MGTPHGGGVRPESRKSNAGCLAGGNVRATWARQAAIQQSKSGRISGHIAAVECRLIFSLSSRRIPFVSFCRLKRSAQEKTRWYNNDERAVVESTCDYSTIGTGLNWTRAPKERERDGPFSFLPFSAAQPSVSLSLRPTHAHFQSFALSLSSLFFSFFLKDIRLILAVRDPEKTLIFILANHRILRRSLSSSFLPFCFHVWSARTNSTFYCSRSSRCGRKILILKEKGSDGIFFFFCLKKRGVLKRKVEGNDPSLVSPSCLFPPAGAHQNTFNPTQPTRTKMATHLVKKA